ncbi:MAG: DUF6125 family protein [Bacteroidota bacterium]
MSTNIDLPGKKPGREEELRLIYDFWHRSMMHYAMWFAEVQHQLGQEKALEVMKYANENAMAIQMKRFAGVFNTELQNGFPKPLMELSDEKIEALKEAVALNWLMFDGVWFQGVEFKYGMNDAKRCNDSCWGQFAPFEAWSIKNLLKMDENPGLEGLKQALKFRLYTYINKQSFREETETAFVFRMDECRVQAARKRKGLEDYPCKSAGLVEFPRFAEAIDNRIKTECICCPPDPHPDEHYCVWRFSMES